MFFCFLEKHYIPHSAVLSLTTCYACARLWQCFGQGGCYFQCDKPCTCNYTCTQRFLLLRSCAMRVSELPRYIWRSGLNRALKINVGLRPGSGLRFRARTGFRLQYEALLQLSVGMWARTNKGRLKGYILHLPTVKIDEIIL